MASYINTNIASLNAQKNLATSQAGLNTALQRLSSGLRINSAKDDAAGLAISDRMSSQITGLNQAARNANDGISLAQTAEGDLAQIGANLQRIRELAVQSSNASNSASDRAALNNEASQLISEIDRVASTSAFNGVKLLDGTFTAQAFQVGANNTSNDRISISSISSAKTASLGVGGSSSYSTSPTAAAATTNALAAGDVTLNGYQVGAASTDGVSFANASASAIAKAAAINAVTANSGVTATVSATSVTGATVSASAALAAGDIMINGVDIGALASPASAAVRGSDMAAAINKVSSQTGVTATFNTTTGAVTLNAADGRNVTVTKSTNSAAGATYTGLVGATGAATTTTANITLSSTSSAGITIGGATVGNAGLTAGYTAATATAGAGVSTLDLTTAAGAQAAISTVDAALSSINSSRAALGAYQNRFTSAVSSLATTSENLSAARSRIQDADFASETAIMTRGQILQQAGTAILAQANSLPQGVLALLR